MHYRKVISLPYMYTLCTLMPELIPYLMLMLIHTWYEESTPHDHCTHNLNYGPFVSQCDAIGAIMCQRLEFMSMLQTLLGGRQSRSKTMKLIATSYTNLVYTFHLLMILLK
jgi:hypothetical protein